MLRRILFRLLLSTIVAGGGAAILLFGIVTFGLVSGEEFAPDTFERRSYWYYELPLIRLKITPIFRKVTQHQLEKMLVAKKYITPSSPPTRWDLIEATRGGETWRTGDANILCAYLDAWDSGKSFTSYWETWTKDHPALAKILWPEIATLARRNLYSVIPSLLDEAQRHTQPGALQSDLKELLARKYLWIAETKVELGQLHEAVDCFSEALRVAPGDKALLEARAECHEALGNTAAAGRDRKAAAASTNAQAEAEDLQPEGTDQVP